MSDYEDTNICLYQKASIDEQKRWNSRGGTETQGFIEAGCYRCNGKDIDCEYFISMEIIKIREMLFEKKEKNLEEIIY